MPSALKLAHERSDSAGASQKSCFTEQRGSVGAPLAAKQTRLALQGGLADCVDFLSVLLRRVRTLRGHADRPGLDRRDISMHIGVGFLATEATYD
jgi:hypothetical protein